MQAKVRTAWRRQFRVPNGHSRLRNFGEPRRAIARFPPNSDLSNALRPLKPSETGPQ